ncbi:MAG TPA: COP23 domain-containing protein [Stenomitos sp.]
MNRQNLTLSLTGLTLLSGLVLGLVPSSQAQGRGPVRFFCGSDAKGTPATMVEPLSKPGNARIVIRWTSSYFSGSGYSPATRCAIVSKKFQDAYIKNPNFVFTTTVANGEPVICAAESRGASCSTLLYTVKRGVQDPILTMLRLEQLRTGASGPLNESSSGSTSEPGYVGVQDVVTNAFSNDKELSSTPTGVIAPAPVMHQSHPSIPTVPSQPVGGSTKPLW